jgi:hypothetical protein
MRSMIATTMHVRRLIHLERHELGPRVYVLRQRVHECALGIGLLAVGPLALLDDFHHPRMGGSVAAAGAYFLVKDWQDLIPSRRNTARWRPLLHRRPRD